MELEPWKTLTKRLLVWYSADDNSAFASFHCACGTDVETHLSERTFGSLITCFKYFSRVGPEGKTDCSTWLKHDQETDVRQNKRTSACQPNCSLTYAVSKVISLFLCKNTLPSTVSLATKLFMASASSWCWSQDLQESDVFVSDVWAKDFLSEDALSCRLGYKGL